MSVETEIPGMREVSGGLRRMIVRVCGRSGRCGRLVFLSEDLLTSLDFIGQRHTVRLVIKHDVLALLN